MPDLRTDTHEPVWNRPYVETNESERDFSIFKSYLTKAESGNVTQWAEANADDLGLSVSTLQAMATRHRWKPRYRAWKAAVLRMETSDAKEVLESLGSARAEMAGMLMDIAREALMTVDPSGLGPKEAREYAKLASEMSRLESGEASSIIRAEDVEGLFAAMKPRG